MHTFADNLGRSWYVAINVARIRRVRAALGVDLYAMVDDGMQELGKLVSDPVRLADVLYVLCKEDAEAKSISDEDFGRALGATPLRRRPRPWWRSLLIFSPRSGAGRRSAE